MEIVSGAPGAPPRIPASADALTGLSAVQVEQRQSRGEVNVVPPPNTRSYKRILREHAFTPINTILYAIAIVLIVLGLWGDALVTGGLVVANVVVGMAQETRAKRKLDHIALLSRPRATVIRDGREQVIDPAEIVRDDLLVLKPGGQVLVDGTLLRANALSVDESLLTGESDPVLKPAGGRVVSGSFAVAGGGVYQAEQVGEQSLAQRMTQSAQAFRATQTPLQQEVGFVLRAIAFLAVALTVQWAAAYYHAHHDLPLRESVQAAAVLVSLVPQGLSLMTTVVYAIAAVRMSGKGALIQRMNAIESCSHVDTLCLDKTGTLTSNKLELREVRSLAGDLSAAQIRARLEVFAASVSDGNRTIDAILAAGAGVRRPVRDEVPFTSERKWSGLYLEDAGAGGVYILGAPEVLAPALRPGADFHELEHEWQEAGLRVLLLAHRPDAVALHDSRGQPRLPADLRPLALLCFADELRDEAQATLNRFTEAGVSPKIISGDNPETVAALARQAGIASTKTLSGLDLDNWDDAQLEVVVQDVNVFGRVTPNQKERIVRLLRRNGHYVAMIGDGVNDVPALKQADLAVAMAGGSEISRAVADVVLLDDSFAALPRAFQEGQRILRGMEDIVCLFLARTLSLAFVILVVALFAVDFPVTPKHNSLLALLTVGIPTLAMAAWAQPGLTPRHIVVSTTRFVLPAAVSIGFVCLVVFFFFLRTMDDIGVARTAMTTTAVLCGIVLILFVDPPSPAWVGGHGLRAGHRQTMLALGMLALFLVALIWPPLTDFFGLSPLPFTAHAMLVLVVIGWAVSLRWLWRLDPRALLAGLRRRTSAHGDQ
ncbi:MAG TPA: HAD-IC family P-type ATPase [Thermomicrobiaceae bacterium]|nr:HAD-IC family P-type ATPase [Thermomicrobiaceae bacterium]